jgi:asparagine synthetase B (glutamine-hydrolysing)
LAEDLTLLVEPGGRSRIRSNPYWIGQIQAAFRGGSGDLARLEQVASAVKASLGHAMQARQARFMMSGGLDSNLLLHASRSPQTSDAQSRRAVTFGFPGHDCDETAETRRSAQLAGADLDVVDLSHRTFGDYRDAQCQRCDVLPHVSTYFVTEAAERARAAGHDTLISGLGGDEIFAIAARRALALHVRCAPATSARFLRRGPRVFWRGLARRILSGAEGSLRPAIEQSNAMFYLAAAQEADRCNVSLRAPFRDAAVLTVALAAACRHVLEGHPPRQFQRDLLDHFQPGLSEVLGRRKAVFNDVVRAESIECQELGEPATPTIAAVTPAFLRVKRAEGVPLL